MNYIKKLGAGLLTVAMAAASAYADVADDARALMDSGDYAAAREILTNALADSPKAAAVPQLNALLGRSLLRLGHYGEARSALSQAAQKGIADAYLDLGWLDYLDYDFDGAQARWAKYEQLRKKARKEVDPALAQDRLKLQRAESMLDNVEDIVILDSIAVHRDRFLNAYRLPASAGRFTTPDHIPFEQEREFASGVSESEKGDYLVWTRQEGAETQIMEASQLNDGSWHMEALPQEILSGGGNTAWPFMMPDGTTLYFASDGDGSIGGLDIFMVTRDSGTGEFMEPSNMGMPYNSPFDDYMLALDEENGIGWWATDRNQLGGGMVTVYLFKLNDLRRNITADSDDEDDEEEGEGTDIIARARLKDWKQSWGTEDYSDLRRLAQSIIVSSEPAREDFQLPMRDERILTTFTQLKSPVAAKMMRNYLAAEEKLAQDAEKLSQLRSRYTGKKDTQTGAQILGLEKSVEQQRQELKELKNEVYRALGEK